MDLTDEQLAKIESVLLPDPVRADGRGRPWSDRRKAMNGILWILRTGAPWKDLPVRYGSYQTVHRRFQSWARSKQLEYLLWLLDEDLRERGGIDVRECWEYHLENYQAFLLLAATRILLKHYEMVSTLQARLHHA